MQPAPLTSPHHNPVSYLLALEAGFSTAAQRPLGPGPKPELVQKWHRQQCTGLGALGTPPQVASPDLVYLKTIGKSQWAGVWERTQRLTKRLTGVKDYWGYL